MSKTLEAVNRSVFSMLITFISATACTQETGSIISERPENQAHEQRETSFTNKGQWANYGNDPGGMRYSPIDQININNVTELNVAWTYQSGELETYEGTEVASKAAFEATPLMIDGILYFSTPTNRVIAVDAGSGREKWVYDPKVDLQREYSEITSRGVSKWIDYNLQPADNGYMRILVATIDGRLIALDSKFGKPIASFGINGTVDLKKDVGRIQVTSPPAVIGDLIITGSTMGDNWRFDFPPGVVRAYNARSGKRMWSWDPIPRKSSDQGFDTWKGPKAQQTGAANAWAPLSVDIERDLVFVPTTCPSPDYYGGERLGDNLFANSIVALKASTGEVQWYFQTVHHDIWDYDNPAQPLLLDMEKDGESVPAVLLVTKMGHIFVFNRESGEHLFPIEEREVPSSDVPGEQAALTQPFPSVLPALGLRKVDLEDGWGLTPELEQVAKERINKYINDGIYTPPSFEGTIVTPSNVGGMNWSGASYDPKRNIMVTNTNRLAALITLFPKENNTRASVNESYPRAEVAPQIGTPYIMSRDYLFTTVNGELIMQTKPPWGTLAAVDLSNGQLKWEVPLGMMLDPDKYPDAVNWGSINIGGAITTASGLVFVAATMDGFFRAFNIENGELLWSAKLPAGGQATPMTYVWEGKQYVVIAAGGHGKFGTKLGDYIVAYALE